MKKYKLIGLTGTTGSGKSEVVKAFETRGFSVIDADFLAREIMKDSLVLEVLQSFFGDDIVENGELIRPLLAKRAFSTKEKTELLSRLTHPFITPLFLKKLRALSESGNDMIVFDAPQLFESGLDVLCDFTVAVTAKPELRLKRITERDGLTAEDAQRRVNAQFSDEFFAENCDFVIENNSTLDELKTAAKSVIDEILR